jgi:hypothetical protein
MYQKWVYLYIKTKLLEGVCETPAGKACPRETPQAVIKEEEILVMAF